MAIFTARRVCIAQAMSWQDVRLSVNPFATRPFAATGYELANLAAEASQHASAI